ncbi:MAG: hypothetical protein P1U80_09425 [Pseudomonadales bacterium]|nr:hypothetical protein [Pseudomonadales bacterium]
MRLLIKLAVVIAALVIAVQYFTKDSSPIKPEAVTITEVQKWQDAQGVWHFSNAGSAPSNSETLKIRSDQNVIKTNYAEQLSVLEGSQAQPNLKQDKQSPDYSSISTIKQGLETLQKAGGVQSMMDQREQTLEKQLEDYK